MQIAGRRGGRVQVPHARVVAGAAALLLSVLVAGCSSAGSSSSNSAGAPPVVTAEQVLTTCFHDYFYNGILPEAAAKANCTSCVERELRTLRIRPTAGETEIDVLTGVRLSASASQALQNACTEADTSSQ